MGIWKVALVFLVLNVSLGWSETLKPSLFDYPLHDIRGQPIDWEKMRGKAILVVNTASYCGFTEQTMRDMTSLYSSMKKEKKPFEIVAFPCDDFGQQEPGSPREIEEFAKLKYQAEYTIAEKVKIVDDPHAIWNFIQQTSGVSPKWNFSKYLFNGDGIFVKAYGFKATVSSILPDINQVIDGITGARTEL